MFYADERVYNDAALTEEHKKQIAFYDYAVHEVQNADACIDFEPISPKIDALIDDFKSAVMAKVLEYLRVSRLELLVSLIDDQQEEGASE